MHWKVAVNKPILTPLSAPSGLLIIAVFALNWNNNETMAPTKRIHCISIMYTTYSGQEKVYVQFLKQSLFFMGSNTFRSESAKIYTFYADMWLIWSTVSFYKQQTISLSKRRLLTNVSTYVAEFLPFTDVVYL